MGIPPVFHFVNLRSPVQHDLESNGKAIRGGRDFGYNDITVYLLVVGLLIGHGLKDTPIRFLSLVGLCLGMLKLASVATGKLKSG